MASRTVSNLARGHPVSTTPGDLQALTARIQGHAAGASVRGNSDLAADLRLCAAVLMAVNRGMKAGDVLTLASPELA